MKNKYHIILLTVLVLLLAVIFPHITNFVHFTNLIYFLSVSAGAIFGLIYFGIINFEILQPYLRREGILKTSLKVTSILFVALFIGVLIIAQKNIGYDDYFTSSDGKTEICVEEDALSLESTSLIYTAAKPAIFMQELGSVNSWVDEITLRYCGLRGINILQA